MGGREGGRKEDHLLGVKAGERGTQNLQEVSCSSEGIIHVVVVCMGMVPMPVQNVIPHIQAVAGDVGWRVAHAVKLIPQHPLCPKQQGRKSVMPHVYICKRLGKIRLAYCTPCTACQHIDSKQEELLHRLTTCVKLG